jgi:serine/threonine protein phosphatase PrpC
MKRPPTSGNGRELVITTETHSTAAVSSIKGLKPNNPNWTNQDNFFVVETQVGDAETLMYCVLDGHGEVGHLVSTRCRTLFPDIIRHNNYDMKKAFYQMQSDLISCEVDSRCSGATCTLALITNNIISVSNCGDSRCVLGRRNGAGGYTAVQLSNDHKPDMPEERKRVLSCGGHLGCRQAMVNQGGRGLVSVPVGPCRVWYQYRGDTLGLAMSRSLGDGIVHKCGVSAEPETLDHTIAEGDEFLIVATDGIWDVVDSNQAVQVVQNFAIKSPNWDAHEAALWLSKYARSRWEKMSPMVDDITCIIVKLSPPPAATSHHHHHTGGSGTVSRHNSISDAAHRSSKHRS